MRVSQKYAGRYFKAEDVQDGELHVQIAQVAEDIEMGKQKEPKDVVYFVDNYKGLVLNATNALTLAKGLGDNSDDWVGRDIVLYPKETSMGPGIEVRVESSESADVGSKPEQNGKLHNDTNPPPLTAKELAELADIY